MPRKEKKTHKDGFVPFPEYKIKFRAEIPSDFARLLLVVKKSVCFLYYVSSFSADNYNMGGMTVTLHTSLSIQEIIKYMEKVQDGHRMIQTINFEDQYTGDIINRDY